MDRFLLYAVVIAAIVLMCGCITIEDTEKTTSTRLKIRTLAEIITTTSTATSTTTSSTSTTLPSCSVGLVPLLCEQSGGIVHCSGGVCVCQCTTTTKATTTTTKGTTSTSMSSSQPASTNTTTSLASSTTTATSSSTTSSSSTSSSSTTYSVTSTTIKERQCADIDQVNIFKKSYIIFENVTYEDYCLDSGRVVEMYCMMNKADGQPMMASQITSCPSGFGCTDGACWPKPTTTVTTLAKRAPPCGHYGDVNGDGFVTSEDVQQLNANTPLNRGDVSGNGAIDDLDKAYMIMYVNREADSFNACS